MVRPPGGVLETELRVLFPRSYPVTFGSGRAALATALMLAMRATGRRVVVLPAYTSFSVAAAAAAAGARVRLCDVDPATLDFDRDDLRACVDHQTAAVVLGNLYGFPSAVWDLAWVRSGGALLVDDAAQALGAADRGQPVGGRGDLGVLSFGRGKCVTTGDGGALLVHDPDLRSYLADRRPPGPRGGSEWLTALAVRLCASPLAFGVASRLPGAGIGESVYEPAFPIRAASASVQGLGRGLAGVVARQLAVRAAVADRWSEALAACPGMERVAPRDATTPAYLRYPVLAPGKGAREDAVRALGRVGFAFVRSYPGTLATIEGFCRAWCDDRATPRAETLADRVIALPCHGGVTARDVKRAAGTLSGILNREPHEAGLAETLASSKV